MKDHFIVCGLGNLGQHCVAALKEFGVTVVGIEDQPPKHWDISGLDDKLDLLLDGDCRRPEVLEQASVHTCRAVLLVTSEAHVNVGTALAVRHSNSEARLVIRSAQDNLNRLLEDYLGNAIAFEATQLPAPAFALAAIGTDTISFFQQEHKWFRVVKRTISTEDTWCIGRKLHRLHNNPERRILRHIPRHGPQPRFTFHAWDPEATVEIGDVLVFMEITRPALMNCGARKAGKLARFSNAWRKFREKRSGGNLKQVFQSRWRHFMSDQTRRVALVYGLVVTGLLCSGTLMFYLFYPQSSILTNFFATTVLLLGGYADVFGLYKSDGVIFPWWLQLIGLFFALSGIALVGVLYGLVTEALLESKFQFVNRRPPVPASGHVVVVGLGRVGRQVATLLHDMGQPVACVALDPKFDRTLLPHLPLITGDIHSSLTRVNLAAAHSVVVSSDEELLNLEVGLMARAANPRCQVVIRTFERSLTDNLAVLLPKSEVICAYKVAADAFTGAAFGENIQGVFRLNNRTILIAEYHIHHGDSLIGRMLAEVAYGFAVVPVLLDQKGEAPKLLPAEELRLQNGDRLVLIATMDGLRRIEIGQRTIPPPLWELRLHSAPGEEALFEAIQLISRIGGYPLQEARTQLQTLPATVRLPLYQYQAHRLRRKLRRCQIQMDMELV